MLTMMRATSWRATGKEGSDDMAKAGDVADNPAAEDRVIFKETAASTGGDLLRYDHFLKVGGRGPREHIHPRQEERFHVVSGAMGVRINGRERVLEKGNEATVPQGARHTWWNAGSRELHQITEFRPAGEFEVFVETLAAVGREKSAREGLPALLQFAVLNHESTSKVYITEPRIPVLAQKAMYRLLAPLAKRFGYYERYQRYALR